MYSHLLNNFSLENEDFNLKKEAKATKISAGLISLNEPIKPKELLLFNEKFLFMVMDDCMVMRVSLSTNTIDRELELEGPILKLAKLSETTIGITVGVNGNQRLYVADRNLNFPGSYSSYQSNDAKTETLFQNQDQLLQLTNYTSLLKISNAWYKDKYDEWERDGDVLLKIYFHEYLPYHNIILNTVTSYKNGFALISKNIDDFTPVPVEDYFFHNSLKEEKTHEYTLSVWEFRNNKVDMIFAATLNQEISLLCVMPNGILVTFSRKNNAEVQMHCWNVDLQQCVGLLRLNGFANPLEKAVRLDNNKIAISFSAGSNGYHQILVVDVENLFYSSIYSNGKVYGLASLPDGRLLYSNGSGIHCVKVDTNKLQHDYVHEEVAKFFNGCNVIAEVILSYLNTKETKLNLPIPDKYTYSVKIHNQIPIPHVKYPTFFHELDKSKIYVGSKFSPSYEFNMEKFSLDSHNKDLYYKNCIELEYANLLLTSHSQVQAYHGNWLYMISYQRNELSYKFSMIDPHVDDTFQQSSGMYCVSGNKDLVIGCTSYSKTISVLNLHDFSSRLIEMPGKVMNVFSLPNNQFAAILDNKNLTLFSLRQEPKKSYTDIMQNYSQQFFKKYQPMRRSELIELENSPDGYFPVCTVM